MKVKVVYEADGVQTMFIDGPQISTQIMPGGRGMVVVRSDAGIERRVVHFGTVYLMDKDKT